MGKSRDGGENTNMERPSSVLGKTK